MTQRKGGVIASSQGDVAAFLNKVQSLSPVTGTTRGRLVFAMDATMSRQPSWDRAVTIQAEMFAETAKLGCLNVQLVYFRGLNECRASPFVRNPAALAKLMSSVTCQAGHTQISRMLAHVRQEGARDKINAMVYVGDAMEEDIDAVCQAAGEIGLLGTKIFAFQDGHDPIAEKAFRQMAQLSGGAYCRLDSSSAAMLRELLAAVAVYAAGGQQALMAHAKERGDRSQLLLSQLRPSD